MPKKITELTGIVALCLCVWPCFPSAQVGIDPVPGAEFTADVNLTEKNVKAEGTIFVPRKVPRVRAVIVTVGRAPLVNLTAEPFYLWRTLSETSECAVLYLRLETIRPDPEAGPVFIRNAAAGGKDDTAGTEDAEALWKNGRSAGAPWTFAIEPRATHQDKQTLVSSQALIIPWIAAVLRQRLQPGSMRLRPVTDDSGWLGNNRSTEVSRYATFPGPKREASWLPDEVTAHGWRTVLGAAK